MATPEHRAAFCMVCGSGLVARVVVGRSRKACPECELVVFENTAAAAAAVVVRGREILMVRRGIDPGRGRWGFPAGFQDYGESLEMTAVREVREETGLDVRLTRLIRLVHSTENPRKCVNLAVYLAHVVAGELEAADDAVEAQFFSLDAPPVGLAFVNNRQILEQLQSEFPTGDIH